MARPNTVGVGGQRPGRQPPRKTHPEAVPREIQVLRGSVTDTNSTARAPNAELVIPEFGDLTTEVVIPKSVDKMPSAKDWHDVVMKWAPRRLLAVADSAMIARYAVAEAYTEMAALDFAMAVSEMSALDRDDEGYSAAREKADKEYDRFLKRADRSIEWAGELGMTPAARMRLAGPKDSGSKNKKDPWSDI